MRNKNADERVSATYAVISILLSATDADDGISCRNAFVCIFVPYFRINRETALEIIFKRRFARAFDVKAL